MKTLSLLLAIALLAQILWFETVVVAAENAGITCAVQKTEGRTEIIVLRTSVGEMSFLPTKGGCCTYWTIKDGSFTFGLQPEAELFHDVFSHPVMEKGGKDLPCQYRVNQERPDRVSLEFTADLNAVNASEAVAGLKLTKRVTAYADKRCLVVEQTLANPTKDVMGAQIGVMQRFFLGEVRDKETIYLPTERSILRVVAGGIDHFYAKMDDWEYHPVEGWMAALNAATKTGLVFVMDDRSLDCFYTSNATGVSGWFLDGGVIDPGGAFTTAYTVIPVNGFTSIAHASRRLVSAIEVNAVGGGLEITHTLAGSMTPIGDVVVKTNIQGARSKKTIALPDLPLTNVGLDPVAGKLTLNQPQTEPLVIRAQAIGKDWQESYETYHEGEFKQTIYPGYPYAPDYKRAKQPH